MTTYSVSQPDSFMRFIDTVLLKLRVHITVIFAFALFFITGHDTSPRNMLLILSFSLCHFAFHAYNKARDRDGDIKSKKNEGDLSMLEVNILFALSFITTAAAILIVALEGGPMLPILFYAAMVFIYNGYGNTNLKKIILVKNMYMAFFYALPLSLFSYFYHPSTFVVVTAETIALIAFFSVLSIEPLWDIKDMEGDLSEGVHTIPNTFGVRATKIYSIVVYCGGMLLVWWLTGVLSVSSIVMYVLFILFIKEKTSIWVYHLPIVLIVLYDIYTIIVG